jgi:GNAT superfamily N-acetyltransferase
MLTCQEARPEDIPGMFRVRLAVVENALTEERLRELGITPESFEAELGKRYEAWVIVEQDEVVGFSVADVTTSSIWALFAMPGHEGRGFGTRLLDRAVECLWSRGATRIWLKTDAQSRAAGFYRRSGWRESATIDNGEITFELEYRIRTDFSEQM